MQDDGSNLPNLDESTLLDSPLFRSKEVSWLAFNARVLQEAEDTTVPLLERIRFLGIYSSNMDEFFRVRVATLKRLVRLGKHYRRLNVPDPRKTLRTVNRIVSEQTEWFSRIYEKALAELEANHVRIITEQEVPAELTGFLENYFRNEVKPRMMPIMIKATSLLVGLRDHPMYLAVRLSKKNSKSRPGHALLEIPRGTLPRFVVLPKTGGTTLVMFLDDIIRFGLPEIFASMPYDQFESYAIKFTRDAEMEFDDDITEGVFEKVSEGLREREKGNPVRLNYDANIPQAMLRLLTKKLHLTGEDTLFPGARYHNRKDLVDFPTFGRDDLTRSLARPVPHHALAKGSKRHHLFKQIRKQDILLHLPYHSFNTFLDLLREASTDPLVHSIFFTQYRLARDSCVAHALINAVKNGKEVTALVEPRARFDEERNITYADAFQDAGVRVILGVPGLKVHAKLCLITRNEGGAQRSYSCIGTGNFNEETAKTYTDHLLLTANPEIAEDIRRIFRFFTNSFRPPILRHLIAAPLSMRTALAQLVQTEIDNATAGKKAEIFIKINNVSDAETVALLYRASAAGVHIRLIVRSMFSLIPGQKTVSENIQAIGLVDRHLEHSRIFIFANDGNPRFFLSSADFLPRNFDSRLEVVCPIYHPTLQAELRHYMDLQWEDNVKARILDRDLRNQYRKRKKKHPTVRAQIAIAAHFAALAENA